MAETAAAAGVEERRVEAALERKASWPTAKTAGWIGWSRPAAIHR